MRVRIRPLGGRRTLQPGPEELPVELGNLVLELPEALALACLFLAQLVVGSLLRTVAHNVAGADQELTVFSLVYLALGLVLGVRARKSIGGLWRRRVTSSTV